MQHGVRSIPTLLYFDQLVGAAPKPTLAAKLTSGVAGVS